jgi:Chlorophyll A-B binding protein
LTAQFEGGHESIFNTQPTMKASTILAIGIIAPVAAFAPSKSSSTNVVLDATKDEIMKSPNTVEFGSVWDPLGLAAIGSDETLSWYRHSEVKHGRVAMAAFVGWWAVGAGLRVPGDLSFGQSFASIPSKGLEAWDAVPGWGKAQLLLFAGLIEFHDELFYSRRSTHYMRGGIPGKVCKDFRLLYSICLATG